MAKIKPTTAELDILTVLWDRGPSSVRDVHNQLSENRDVFYTTTLKTMQVMITKKLLNRDTSERACQTHDLEWLRHKRTQHTREDTALHGT